MHQTARPARLNETLQVGGRNPRGPRVLNASGSCLLHGSSPPFTSGTMACTTVQDVSSGSFSEDLRYERKEEVRCGGGWVTTGYSVLRTTLSP